MHNKEINTYNADERKYQIYWLKTVYKINSNIDCFEPINEKYN
jgi:hypothetical protein